MGGPGTFWETSVRELSSLSPLVKSLTGLAMVLGAVLTLCLFSASLGHLLLRMNACEPELSLSLRQASRRAGSMKRRSPSDVKLAVTVTDDRLMEGTPELSTAGGGELGRICPCCGGQQWIHRRKGREAFSAEAGRP